MLRSACVIALSYPSLVFSQTTDPIVTYGTTEIDISVPYDYRAYVVTLAAGTCDESSSGVTTSQAVDNTLSITLDIADCGLTVGGSNAIFEVGGVDGATSLTLAEYNITFNPEYTFKIQYTYGSVEKDPIQLLANDGGALGTIEFTFEEYDQAFTGISSNPNKIAGTPVYLGISVSTPSFDHAAYNFAVTQCTIYPQANQAIQYTFYNYQTNTCGNDMIGLEVTYDETDQMWRVTHQLFLLNGDNGVELEVECEVKVCHQLFATACNTVAESCMGCTKACQNSGTCYREGDLVTEACNCPLPYTGEFCETEMIPVCTSSNPCQNSQPCIDSADLQSATCDCNSPFTGTLCETVIVCEATTPCIFGGDTNANCTWHEDTEVYSCQCSVGYEEALGGCGLTVVDPCDPDPCNGGGTCADDGQGSFTCTCDATHTGDTCEIEMPCETFIATTGNPCNTGSNTECINDADYSDYSCGCAAASFTGAACDIPIPCAFGPVGEPYGICDQTGGETFCTNTADYSSFTCGCNFMWTGITCATQLKCSDPVDPCTTPDTGATCVDIDADTFRCDCSADHLGDYCETPIPCLTTADPCSSFGLTGDDTADCHNTADYSSYDCDCAFPRGGNACQYNLPCSVLNPCQNDALGCTDIFEPTLTFLCECSDGWEGFQCTTPSP